ncbi:MAG: DUF2142 domain-containing protein [Verrucomicrobiota bacterium]
MLCCLGAIHVFAYAAAFPFFNNVDEQAHFDLVIKYSHADVPRGMELISEECVPYFAFYSASFYLGPATSTGEFLPPPWEWPSDKKELMVNVARSKLGGINHESSQPPLYYAVAGLWWRLGGWLGLDAGNRLYWLHFLNVPLIVVLVWLGWLTVRRLFPEEMFLRVGVAGLLAFLPQSAFYSIQNDVLSPICFGAALLGLICLLETELTRPRLGAATGLALAATFLVKQSNLPLLVVVVVLLVVVVLRLWRLGRLAPAWPSLTILAACAAGPAVVWMAWCHRYFGSLSGAAPKIAFLGWTLKPFHEWWHHPLFTWHGLGTFVFELLSSFWQGEMMQHGRPLARPLVSAAYVAVTLLFLVFAAIGVARRFPLLSASQRQVLGLSFLAILGPMLFLAFLSLIYDFHDCLNPSRAKPFFIAGRDMLGALVPFSLLFMLGFDRLLRRLTSNVAAKYIALAAFILYMVIAEMVTNYPVFFDAYNWFHL